ncbi:hypothetical protein [Pedococcus bigeumensis]|uniref:TolB family protein n=1 Tax=Pedococcus bigeumensis TaxID=433644 RepID=UPI002FE9FE9F
MDPGAPAALACGAWSPDAKRLACEGFDDAHPDRAGIYTVSSGDGQHPVRVTKQHDIPCSYSPDGKRILFLRNAGQEENNTLMTANIDGTDPRTVIPEKVGLSCDWSPDGKTILSERESSLILIHPPSEKIMQVPIATGGRAGRGAFSPDGSHIIFSLNLAKQEDI